jgi:Spy/CpxP family protein refolding chaperone
MKRPSLAFKHFILIGALVLPTLASAHGMPPGPEACPPPLFGHAGQPPMPAFLRGLTLSEAQQDAVFDLFNGQAHGMRERKKVIDKAEKELRAMALSADFDDARAHALVEAAGIAMAQIKYMQVRTDHQLYTLLTPEQRQQLDAGTTRPPARPHADLPGQLAPRPAPR